MPRRRRLSLPDYPLHVIQRGHNRSICFTCDQDMAAYANWLQEGADKFSVDIHAWVFMNNHVHLLLTPRADRAVSKLMQFLGRLYVRKFNYTYARSGGLFEDRFKSSLVQEDRYLLACLRYIELNPVRAGMVKDPGDYAWSSYRAHAFGHAAQLWKPHDRYIALGSSSEARQRSYRELVAHSQDTKVINDIRHCTNKGLIIGTEEFRQQCVVLAGDLA